MLSFLRLTCFLLLRFYLFMVRAVSLHLLPEEDDFFESARAFLRNTAIECKLSGLTQWVRSLRADHLCYRVETIDRWFEIMLFLIPRYGFDLAITEIGGRPIAIVELFQPIEVADSL